jgi:predicted amidophosphoribosyltransferase
MFNPIPLKGIWFEGYALDIYTIDSKVIDYDELGNPKFETKRTELGELLYRLKYCEDISVLEIIVNKLVDFIKFYWKINNIPNGIVPVPPSNVYRKFQPVLEIAGSLGNKLNIPVYSNILIKERQTPELKNIDDYEKRIEILEKAFNISLHARKLLQNKNILLFDDLYRSGATLTVITKILINRCLVQKVYVLTLTKTRRKS